MRHSFRALRSLGVGAKEICRPREKEMLSKTLDCLRNPLSAHLLPMRPSSFSGWRATGLLLTGLSLAFGTAAYAGSGATPEAVAAGKRMAANYGKIPLSFEANQG
jgi:hypothetical protein